MLGAVSVLALGAAALVAAIGEGPYGIPKTGPLRMGAILQTFRLPAYRGATLGFFGPMWELSALCICHLSGVFFNQLLHI